MSHIMTRSSSAIAYTIYYVYVYINVCSRHSCPARVAPPPASFPCRFRCRKLTGSDGIYDDIFQRRIVAKRRVKSKEERNGRDECASVQRGRELCESHLTIFSPSQKRYNLRYVASPSKIHFTIHTNIYNRYINNMADNRGGTASGSAMYFRSD